MTRRSRPGNNYTLRCQARRSPGADLAGVRALTWFLTQTVRPTRVAYRRGVAPPGSAETLGDPIGSSGGLACAASRGWDHP